MQKAAQVQGKYRRKTPSDAGTCAQSDIDTSEVCGIESGELFQIEGESIWQKPTKKKVQLLVCTTLGRGHALCLSFARGNLLYLCCDSYYL
jgi:hypothetical protein